MYCFDIFFSCAPGKQLKSPGQKKKFLETLLIAWLGPRCVPTYPVAMETGETNVLAFFFPFSSLHTHSCFQPGLETLKFNSSVPGKEKKKTTKRLMYLLLWSLIVTDLVCLG